MKPQWETDITLQETLGEFLKHPRSMAFPRKINWSVTFAAFGNFGCVNNKRKNNAGFYTFK